MNQAAEIDIRIVQAERLQLHSGIKHLGFIISALWLALTLVAGADFTQTLTSEKIRAAGLGKLTPEELQQLDAFVQEYKAASPAPALPAPSSPVLAEVHPPAAPSPAKPISAPAETAPKSTGTIPAWVGALLTLERSSKQADKSEALESRLVGEFSGWSGRTTFRLENGQVWVQANSNQHDYTPSLNAPKVTVYPASAGSFWLVIEGVNARCRVKPVRME